MPGLTLEQTVRIPEHRYEDPLDRIWLTTAARIGLRVERSPEVYAATDGANRLLIGEHPSLDPDDCLAQMIFHELCHSLIEGAESFELPDWGLDNTSDRDVEREHACLRLQAFLAARYGLRRVLAPTTDFRSFYDQLPEDPFEPRRAPSTAAAILGVRRADKPPWGPHLSRALAATSAVAGSAARFVDDARGMPSLWTTADSPPPRHPLGLPTLPWRAPPACSSCGWRDDLRCQQHDGAEVDPSWPGCERWEPTLDCTECGACCRAAYDSVTVERDDPVIDRQPDLVIDRGSYVELERAGNRCAALSGGESPASPYHCRIYSERPQPCRDFERGGEHCVTARRRVGLSL